MSNLDSLFNIIGHDPHPNARAGLMSVFDVDAAPSPYDSLPAGGTPIAGPIFPGAIVVMKTNGKVILADNADALTNAPSMLWVALDGDQDYDGAFVHRVTCVQGGAEYQLDSANFVADTYLPGQKLTCGSTTAAGKFRKAASTEQIYGIVGQLGQDTIKNTLHVIIPQGIAPAA